ncbi:8733_t:CDS:2, partial [Entrophospora sp. SA101]
ECVNSELLLDSYDEPIHDTSNMRYWCYRLLPLFNDEALQQNDDANNTRESENDKVFSVIILSPNTSAELLGALEVNEENVLV